MGPGTAPTILLYSVANLAVISVPDFSAASITIVIEAMPASSLFLAGKVQGAPLRSGGNSLSSIPPDWSMCSASALFCFGYRASQFRPEPGNAMVGRPAARAASWAMVSMPIARPETMVTGYPAKPFINNSQTSFPYGVWFREPTTVMSIVSLILSSDPRPYNSVGGWGSSLRSGKYLSISITSIGNGSMDRG